MRTKLFRVVWSGLLVLLLEAATSNSASSAQASDSPTTPGTPAARTVTCDFSNPGYSGWCRVTKQLAAGKRARGFCAQVLTCLNDVRCIRTYCDATTIRGGWKLEKIEATPKAPKAP